MQRWVGYCMFYHSSRDADTALPVIADEVKFTLSDAELTGISGQHLSQVVKHQGAAFIKLHFKQLSLPKGAILRVKSPRRMRWLSTPTVS